MTVGRVVGPRRDVQPLPHRLSLRYGGAVRLLLVVRVLLLVRLELLLPAVRPLPVPVRLVLEAVAVEALPLEVAALDVPGVPVTALLLVRGLVVLPLAGRLRLRLLPLRRLLLRVVVALPVLPALGVPRLLLGMGVSEGLLCHRSVPPSPPAGLPIAAVSISRPSGPAARAL